MSVRRILKWPSLPSVALFLVIVVINSFLSKNFMSLTAWTSFLQTTTPIILISIGMAVVMLGGGIDLSLGSIVSVVNVIMVTTSGGFKDIGLQYTANIVSVPLILSFVVAIGFGLFNGLLISVLRINPLLATFASSFVGSGVALTILPTPVRSRCGGSWRPVLHECIRLPAHVHPPDRVSLPDMVGALPHALPIVPVLGREQRFQGVLLREGAAGHILHLYFFRLYRLDRRCRHQQQLRRR